MKIEQRLRKPTLTETELMRRLLSVDFDGRQEIARQLEDCQVRTIDDEGSLEIKPGDGAAPAAVKKRVPVEEEGNDADGIHVHLLLHVVNGFVKEFEIYNDGSPIKRMPNPANLEVMVLPA